MKHMEDSRTENTYLIMNKHINGYGRLFGGVLMQWIDEMAGIVAYRHAGTIVTTACVDNLNFKAGAYLGDTVVLIGKLTYVGRTSMEVRIDTYVESPDGTRRVINRAYEVMVALDENDNKVEVPGLIVETESEKLSGSGHRSVMNSERKDAERATDNIIRSERKEVTSYGKKNWHHFRHSWFIKTGSPGNPQNM